MNRLSSWMLCCVLAVSGMALRAAETNAPAAIAPGGTNLTLSAMVAQNQRAPWQQHLTLGAGDTLNLALFDATDTEQKEVPIGPDGRISFLQARDIMAAGLTIDELRAKFDEALGKFYQNPRTLISPAAYHSKKYFVLGAVVNKGVYMLDRPLTVIEALARAGGLETGLYERNTVELADLSRSFLVRNGQRLPVDFERLFQHGDLAQNVTLSPDDYLYFAVASANEIYVLGEVNNPGVAAFLPRSTVVGAISARGGFTIRAFKKRVLVVRGSLNHPQSFAVDTGAILTGKAKDFPLQAKDIVYVSVSPWVRAEELVDTATTAFIQGFVVSTTTKNIGPIITTPIF